MKKLTDIPVSKQRKCLLWGPPKEAGKTTLALSAPGNKLLLKYDMGGVFTPPGVDINEITVHEYEAIIPDINPDSTRWDRPTEVGTAIIKDLYEIRSAFLERRPIRLGEAEMPLPDTLILDGMVQFREHLLDWIIGTNRHKEATDFSNRYEAWGIRLDKMQKILNMVIPLPCNVVLITWHNNADKQALVNGQMQNVKVDEYIPDLGGALDVIGPGKVDNSFYCYSEYTPRGTKYLVRLKPNAKIRGVGVRGRYDKEEIIDVTIDEHNPVRPWDKVFGGDKAEVKGK